MQLRRGREPGRIASFFYHPVGRKSIIGSSIGQVREGDGPDLFCALSKLEYHEYKQKLHIVIVEPFGDSSQVFKRNSLECSSSSKIP